jgi:hypothetical protein
LSFRRDSHRYGCAVRVQGVALLMAGAFAVAGCSGSGNGSAADAAAVSHPDRSAACALVKKLNATGTIVARADVKDPARFDAAMHKAVRQYTDTLDALRRVVPKPLVANVDRLHAAVDQYRFNDGIEDHVALDDFASRNC